MTVLSPFRMQSGSLPPACNIYDRRISELWRNSWSVPSLSRSFSNALSLRIDNPSFIIICSTQPNYSISAAVLIVIQDVGLQFDFKKSASWLLRPTYLFHGLQETALVAMDSNGRTLYACHLLPLQNYASVAKGHHPSDCHGLHNPCRLRVGYAQVGVRVGYARVGVRVGICRPWMNPYPRNGFRVTCTVTRHISNWQLIRHPQPWPPLTTSYNP